MTALPFAALDPTAAPVRRPATPVDAWQKAMVKFQTSLQRADRVSKAHSDADKAMFAARTAVEAVKPPASLTVQLNCELYFDDGLRAPVERRYVNDLDLRDEETIRTYAKDDEERCNFLLAELNGWRNRCASAEVAYEKAKAVSAAKEAISAAAMDRSDAHQLRLLCTPAPSLSELLWKIEQLRKQDCSADTEERGWDHVLEELAAFAKEETDRCLN